MPVWGAAVPALTGLSGNTSMGTVANSSSITLDGKMTLEAWLYPTGWRSYSGAEKHGLNFIYKGRIGSHIDYVFALQENGILALGNTRGYIGVLNHRVPLNKWTHVAVTVNESTGSFVFYINGVNVGAGSGWQGASLSRTSFITPSSNPLYIGGFDQLGWGYNNDNFIGKVADVRIWNIVRTSAEISANYKKQLRGTESGLVMYHTFSDLKDKTKYGNNIKLGGSAKLSAGQGPDLQSADGIKISITSPTNNFIGSPGNYVPLTVAATSTVGSVDSVRYYANNELIGSSSTSPNFAFTWSDIPVGVFKIKAIATNSAQYSGTSDEITVKVPGPYNNSPATIPGYVFAERFDAVNYSDTTTGNAGGAFRTTEDVDIAAQSVASNGFTVGWTLAGEWLQYTLNVESALTYKVQARVAAKVGGGQFRVLLNGTSLGTVTVPATGGWESYQWLDAGSVFLPVGVSTMKVEMVKNSTSTAIANFDLFLLGDPPPPVQGPYLGKPLELPGTVQAENFDGGGPDLAYMDKTLGNTGLKYRLDESVDITNNATAGNGHIVGWTEAGEWMEYTVNVQTAGLYRLESRLAATNSGSQFKVLLNGTNNPGLISVPNTKSWTTYQTVTNDKIRLDVGVHTMRVEMVTATCGKYVANFDYFRYVMTAPDQVAYNETRQPWIVPAVIQFEDFDIGGANVAYRDGTTSNLGGVYRAEAVDVASAAAASNGYVVGWTTVDEWLEYTINVTNAGPHWVSVNTSAKGAGGRIRFNFEGATTSALLFDIPNTGSWDVFKKQTVKDIALNSGIHTVRVTMVKAGTSGYAGNLDYFSIAPPPGKGPFGGTAWAIPGRVEFENYDEGSADVSYYDTTASNQGNAYRTDESVDVAAVSGAGNGYVVGWPMVGEWLEYTVDVKQTGLYVVTTRLASPKSGGQVKLTFRGASSTNVVVDVPATGGWSTFKELKTYNVALNSGIHTVRVDIVKMGNTTGAANLDWFEVAAQPAQTPFSGTAVALPGQVECENYDKGGPYVAYYDTTSSNQGKAYRTDETVDVAAVSGASNGYVVGWPMVGEWLEYTVNVTNAGWHDVTIRTASPKSGGQVRISFSDPSTGFLLFNIPATGAWNKFQETTMTAIDLKTGIHTVRVDIVKAGNTTGVANLDWFKVTPVSSPAAKSKTVESAADAFIVEIADVLTSDEELQPAAGWLTTDGDWETIWTGTTGRDGWWLALALTEEQAVSKLYVDTADESAADMQVLYSLDAQDWLEMEWPHDIVDLRLRYLWLLFRDTGGIPPAIREISLE